MNHPYPLFSGINELDEGMTPPDDTENMTLIIPKSLDVLKRVNATDEALDVEISKSGDCICIETKKGHINLVFTLDELRSIMRLFDVPKAD